MKQKKYFFMVFILTLFLVTGFSRSSLSLPTAGKPGAYFWGDLNGSGMIDGPDLTELRNALFGRPYIVENVIPASGYTQELSGTGNWPEGWDLTLLKDYLKGDFSLKPGHPKTILLEGATFLVEPGDSVEISAYCEDSATVSNLVKDKRAGWGIIFRINTAPAAGRCTTAQIQGRDVLPQGGQSDSDTTWFPHVTLGNTAEAFAYTFDADFPDNGLATVKILAGSSCQLGDSIEVSVFIPSDAEAHILQNRNPARIESSQTIRIILYPGPITCTIPEECPGGFCVDGYCCNNQCSGTCMACNVAGLEGICSPIPYGDDPDLECYDGLYGCSGWCDGIGACDWSLSNGVVCDMDLCGGCEYVELLCLEGGCSQYGVWHNCKPYTCFDIHVLPCVENCCEDICYSDISCCWQVGAHCNLETNTCEW